MKKFKKSLAISLVLSLGIVGGFLFYQYKKENPGKPKQMTMEQLAEQTIQTNQISTNLNSGHLIQVKYSLEMDSKKTKKKAEKIVPIIESDIIKVLSKSNKSEFKELQLFEIKIKEILNERLYEGKVVNVYTTQLLIQ